LSDAGGRSLIFEAIGADRRRFLCGAWGGQ